MSAGWLSSCVFGVLYYLTAENWECSRFPFVEVWLFDVRVMGIRVFIRHGGLFMRSPAVTFPGRSGRLPLVVPGMC